MPTVRADWTRIEQAEGPFSKRYLKYLAKKYLKKNQVPLPLSRPSSKLPVSTDLQIDVVAHCTALHMGARVCWLAGAREDGGWCSDDDGT